MRKFFLSIVAIALAITLAACNQKDDETKQDQSNKVTPVETIQAEKGDLVIEKKIYGRMAAEQMSPVMLQNPGEIDSLKVEEGEQVNKDDLLATVKTPMGTENIRAPQKGTVVNLTVEEGETVSNEDPLAMVATLDAMKMEFSVTANDHDLLEKDDKRKVTIDDQTFDATISKIGSSPNETGLYPVEATIDEEDVHILIGTVAEMAIPVKRVTDTIIVPTETIVEKGGESFVFVIEDDQAVETKVTIQETQSDRTAIKGDVKKGDEIVTIGQLSLVDGSKVNVVEVEE
ncbi:MAG TPA: efflux RND transporter periplasmic adaptor subunit [Bacillota bacterium]